jgi:hypothetical protein
MPVSKKRGAAPYKASRAKKKPKEGPSLEEKQDVGIPNALDIGRTLRPALKDPPNQPKEKKTKKSQTATATKATMRVLSPTGEAWTTEAPDSVATSLSTDEARLWSQPFAARNTANRHNPGRQVRLVGTITRTVHYSGKDPLQSMNWSNSQTKVHPIQANIVKSGSQPTRNQAKKQVLKEMGATVNEGQLLIETEGLLHLWKKSLKQPYSPGYDSDGEMVDAPHPQAVKVSRVLGLLESGALVDDQPDLVKDWYHGLRRIPVDTSSVLVALIQSCLPRKLLYDQPLLVAYVVPKLIDTKAKSYSLTIPVYANRMLFEITDVCDTHTIWSALDEGSHRVVQPLSLPPHIDLPVFQSAPTPKVIFDDSDEDEDSSEEDNSKDDVLLQTSTRRSDHMSAYSVAGLYKLLENVGCEMSSWPTIEARLCGKIQVQLLPHQMHGISWMIQQEQIKGGLNTLLWEELEFADGQGTYFFSPAVGQVRLVLGGTKNNLQASPAPVGGILADEMGLGKTVQVLALILATREKKDDDATTLIVVPPALLTQWQAEIRKITGLHLKTEIFNPVASSFRPAFPDQRSGGAVDIVLTTYAALSLNTAAKTLQSISWKRIVLDEMQELRSGTTQLAKHCQNLTGHRRWMLSGTPLFEGVEDLKGELCFLGLEPFAALSDDGFFDFCIKQQWEAKSRFGLENLLALSLVMLRRSKTMSYLDPIRKKQVPLLGLPPLTVIMEPVVQDPSERAIYCYLEYLVHSTLTNRDEDRNNEASRKKITSSARTRAEGKRRLFLRLLREACVSCHLITGGPGCPSRLDTLDRVIIEHNRQSPSLNAPTGRPKKTNDAISCDEAIDFLSQVIDTVRVETGFETTQLAGGGMGRNRRHRATESAAEKLDSARKRLESAKKQVAIEKSKRAKTRWHQALEMITTGALEPSYAATGNSAIQHLWQWRHLTIHLIQEQASKSPPSWLSRGWRHLTQRQASKSPPSWLRRGWRPTNNFYHSPSFYRARDNWRHLVSLVVEGEAFCKVGHSSKPGNLNLKENASLSKLNSEQSMHEDDSYEEERQYEGGKLTSQTTTRKCHALWRWRFILNNATGRAKTDMFPFKFLEKHDRTLSLLRLSKRQPIFRWAHPFTALLEEIPVSVTLDELKRALSLNPKQATHNFPDKIVSISQVSQDRNEAGNWKAYARFSSPTEFARFLTEAKKIKGVELETQVALPSIEEEMERCRVIQKDAKAAFTVYPCDANAEKRKGASKAYSLAQLGLRMHFDAYQRPGHIIVRPPLLPAGSSRTSLEGCSEAIRGCNEKLQEYASILSEAVRKVENLENAVRREVSQEVQNLSTFEILETLKAGDRKSAICPVCLCPLGEEGNGTVSMTRCGHIFCCGCLQGYITSKRADGNNSPPCIQCRKRITPSETVVVDPGINDDESIEQQRERARTVVREASHMLEQSNGHLSPDLWQALYMSFRPPMEIGKTRHKTHTTIPAPLLAHFRTCTGLPLVDVDKVGAFARNVELSSLSSKIRRLLADLPKTERSVVFATSRDTVKHLLSVLGAMQFHVRGLFTGQEESGSRQALEDWRGAAVGILVVQSGAAACGLTLTDASKMFLMEPFLRHEEEQQAYSRLHRYGQTKKVECKVYYTPVSVESRLLEWRKKEESSNMPDERVVFAQLHSDEDVDEEEDDVMQSRYLLGLDQPGESPSVD